MANDLCDGCQAEPVAFIVGNAESGAQQFLGPACFARFGLDFAKLLLPAEEIANILGPMFVEGSTDPATAAQAPKRQKGKAKAAKSQDAPSGPATGSSEVAATAEDG